MIQPVGVRPVGNPKRAALGVLSVLVSAGLIYWLLSRIDMEHTLELLAQANWSWLVLATLLTLALPFTSVFRWLGVLKAQHIRLPFGMALRAVMMANVLNSFLPSKTGDIAKATYLREHGGLAKGTGTVILERLVDLGVLGALGLLGLLVNGTLWGLVAGGALLGGVLGRFRGRPISSPSQAAPARKNYPDSREPARRVPRLGQDARRRRANAYRVYPDLVVGRLDRVRPRASVRHGSGSGLRLRHLSARHPRGACARDRQRYRHARRRVCGALEFADVASAGDAGGDWVHAVRLLALVAAVVPGGGVAGDGVFA